MTGPFGFPTIPGEDPTTQALDAVVAAGRRRLRRQAGWSAAALAGVAAVFLGLGLPGAPGDDADVLIPASPEPRVSAGPTTAPEPERTPQPQTGAASAAGPAAPGASPQAAPGRPGTPVAPGAASGQTPAAAAGPDRARTTPYRESPSTNTGAAASCPFRSAYTGADPGTELCLEVGNVTEPIKSGEDFTLELRLCNSLSSEQSVTLNYPTGREHDLAVRRDGTVRWTWSRQHTFPQGQHSRELERGDCLVWFTTWDTRDDSGRLVEPGTYVMSPSAEINGTSESRPFQIEVTG